MSDIVERLKGSPHTYCVHPACFGGFQVCPHDDEEIIDGLSELCDEAKAEIERLRKALKDAKVELAELRYELNGPRR